MRRKVQIFTEHSWVINNTEFQFFLHVYEDEEMVYNTSITYVNRERNNTSAKKWNNENKEKCNINQRRWWEKNKEKGAILNKKWRKNNPEKMKIIDHNKRAIRNNWGKPNPINKPFNNSILHHLHINNTCDCIYVPSELHKLWHSYKNEESMIKINIEIIEWYNKQHNLGLFKGDAL